jgi:hypothetical protein
VGSGVGGWISLLRRMRETCGRGIGMLWGEGGQCFCLPAIGDCGTTLEGLECPFLAGAAFGGSVL